MRTALAVALMSALLGGCATNPPPSSRGILVAAPEGATVKVRPGGQQDWTFVGNIRGGTLALLAPSAPTVEIEAYVPGSIPARVALGQPFPSRLELHPPPGPQYLTDLLLRENVRFVQRGPGLLLLEPANRPVKQHSSYRVFVPRRQEEVVFFVTEITPDYVMLCTEEGERLAFPILQPPR